VTVNHINTGTISVIVKCYKANRMNCCSSFIATAFTVYRFIIGDTTVSLSFICSRTFALYVAAVVVLWDIINSSYLILY